MGSSGEVMLWFCFLEELISELPGSLMLGSVFERKSAFGWRMGSLLDGSEIYDGLALDL